MPVLQTLVFSRRIWERLGKSNLQKMKHYPKRNDDDGPGFLIVILGILAAIGFSILKNATK